MSDLFARIADSASLSPDVARKSVGYILAFLRDQSSDPAVSRMISETPGATDALESAGDENFDGGIMALGAKLMGLGLDMGQIRTVGEELVSYSREHTDEDTVSSALASVPALAPFI